LLKRDFLLFVRLQIAERHRALREFLFTEDERVMGLPVVRQAHLGFQAAPGVIRIRGDSRLTQTVQEQKRRSLRALACRDNEDIGRRRLSCRQPHLFHCNQGTLHPDSDSQSGGRRPAHLLN